MLEMIRQACLKLLTEYNDFWLLAAISDWSYEEGIMGGRNKGYARAVDSFARAGVPGTVIHQLREGINSNLAAILLELGVDIHRRNMIRGQDLELRNSSSSSLCAVEIKMLYDCTLAKYYPEVAVDRERLCARAARGEEGFQIVFFTQLPHFHYPSGRWYGSSRSDKARQTKWVGIDSQFRQLSAFLPILPTWPDNAPYRQSLTFPTEVATQELLVQRYQDIFTPDHPWVFDAAQQLRNAAVGVAIWSIN